MTQQRTDWRAAFEQLLPLFGHRNWILIADAAFPAQVGAVEVIATQEDHLSVVEEVLGLLRSAPHVRPVPWLDLELNALTEALAPGVAVTRAALDTILDGLAPRTELHESLLKRIGETAQSYRVLVLKTTGTVPYSSVFVELDCGYWSPENEAHLRAALTSARKPTVR